MFENWARSPRSGKGKMMQIGTFRRQVAKTLTAKSTKLALRTVSKSTARTQAAQATVALKTHTGQLLQTMGQYLLGFQQTQEMKDFASRDLGDIGYDLTALARVFKVKTPSSTKKSKLSGTRAAALLQLDSLATDLLRQVEQSLFTSPKTTKVKKMVTMPQKGGVKEEREVDVVDAEAEGQRETARQEEMRSFLSAAMDVYWRLCFDITGKAPEVVLDAKYARMQQDHPGVAFDADAPKKPKAKKAKETKEAVPA
jgi:hypothetical protein